MGVIFMVPLRTALIVEEHGTLPFPEGTACAEILLAGENSVLFSSGLIAGEGLIGFLAILALIYFFSTKKKRDIKK